MAPFIAQPTAAPSGTRIRLGGYGDRYRVADMVFLNDQEGWATGRRAYYDVLPPGAFIAHTTDGGQTWTRAAKMRSEAVYSRGVWFIDAQNGWVDASPYLLRTHDGGSTWEELHPSNMPYKVLRFIDTHTGFGLAGCEILPLPRPTYSCARATAA